jgi:hypothetical protein
MIIAGCAASGKILERALFLRFSTSAAAEMAAAAFHSKNPKVSNLWQPAVK